MGRASAKLVEILAKRRELTKPVDRSHLVCIKPRLPEKNAFEMLGITKQ